eukprot:TRINITY_DN82851_c0_g1_i1.p1 TRINITY_DN82851_c0_g1~~TRINITY_DN82851_c0_g1_i1.p1  ORF type:complete len:477 (-),score=156.53 TRINITY_DN82851_c0_g1_i1:124-1554(-)
MATLRRCLLGVLVSCCLTSSSSAAAAAAEKAAEFFRLAQHSFEQSLTYSNGLGNWLQSAATMALRDRVQLMPPVPDRHGLFWSRKAVQTQDFEILVRFVAMSSTSDGFAAFWLGADDFASQYNEQTIVTASKNWTQGLATAGLDFTGNSPHFKGTALFLLGSEATGKAREHAVTVRSDGSEKLSFEHVQKGLAKQSEGKDVNWLNSEMVLKIRVHKDGSVVGSMAKKAEEPNFLQLFSLPAGTHTSDKSYFGFSGWSGSKNYIQFDINCVETRNFDPTKSGEDLSENLASDAEEWRKTLEEEKRYISKVSQMEAVQRLTKLLSDHVDKYNEAGKNIQEEVAKMEKRLDLLGQDFGKLFAETEAFDFKTNTFNADAVKDHLNGVKSILSQAKDVHESKFSQVHEKAKDLKTKGGVMHSEEKRQKVNSASDQAKLLEEYAEKGSTQTTGLLASMIVSVGVLLCLFLKRMRYYEKKHYI